MQEASFSEVLFFGFLCFALPSWLAQWSFCSPPAFVSHPCALKNVLPGNVGRKKGTTKTTKEEDKVIMATFKKLRPPGAGVDSRLIHDALPKKVKNKVSMRTVRRRLAAKGYKPERKIQKSDPGEVLSKKRVAFAKKHLAKTPQQWKAFLQAVGDIKEFTYYPKKLRGKMKKLRAPWTYMKKQEKYLPAFVRPKQWFPRKEYKKTIKQKVFGLTTSTGKLLALKVPKPWNSEVWAKMVKQQVAPFLRKSFPGKEDFQILLDGEQLLRGPPAMAAFRECNIKLLPDWPKYSPDLNPQEHVWPAAENYLRNKLEKPQDNFAKFQQNVLAAVRAYPAPEKLVPSMAKRCTDLVLKKGAMLKL